MLYDLVLAEDVGSEHLLELRACACAVRARRDEDRHRLWLCLAQLVEQHWQHAAGRKRASDVADDDAHARPAGHALDQRWPRQWLLQCLQKRGPLVSQAWHEARLDDIGIIGQR